METALFVAIVVGMLTSIMVIWGVFRKRLRIYLLKLSDDISELQKNTDDLKRKLEELERKLER